MPVWQAIYEEINDPNFVIICAAEDTGGESVAGPIFDAAKATYVQIVDVDHLVSSAFNFVNVPSAAWIDEEGRIVRIDEGTYSKTHKFGDGEQAFTFGTDVYAPALKDWVAKGARSAYVQSATTVVGKFRQHGFDRRRQREPRGWRHVSSLMTTGVSATGTDRPAAVIIRLTASIDQETE